MARPERYQHGQFSWVDLMTPDAAAAKDFYQGLFGWSHVDFPTDQGGVYTQFTYEDLAVAGLGEMPDDMKSAGLASFWNSYVTVNDADEVAGRVEELGGKVKMPVMQVMRAGRVALVADAEGAQLAIWQPGDHVGAGLVNEPVSFCWNELLTGDVERARRFYQDLFGWEIAPSESAAHDYYEIRNDGRMNGGVLPWSSQMGDVPPNWGVYFSVADCDATVSRVVELGGRTIVPATDIEPGRFSMLADPAGAVFSVIHLHSPE